MSAYERCLPTGGVRLLAVGLIEEGSTSSKPLVLIAQVQSYVDEGKVSLLWYECKKPLYSLKLDGNRWIEGTDCLVAVKMNHAKNKPGCYRLATGKRYLGEVTLYFLIIIIIIFIEDANFTGG